MSQMMNCRKNIDDCQSNVFRTLFKKWLSGNNEQAKESKSTQLETQQPTQNDHSIAAVPPLVEENKTRGDVTVILSPTMNVAGTETTSTPTVNGILTVPSTAMEMASTGADFQTPSPKNATINRRALSEAKARSECRSKVVEASEALAEAEFYPENKKTMAERAFRIAGNKSAIQASKLNKLMKMLNNEPWLLKARSFGLGLNCPDGYTLLMAAALGGQVDAAKIILDAAAIHKENIPGMESLHLDRNILGKAAIAIAAESGHMEMVNFLTPLHMIPLPEAAEVSKLVLSPPIDSLGRTPLGNAIMSPNPKAKSNKKALESKLFSPEDNSIRGKYHPVEDRMTVLPTELQMAYGTSEMPGRRIAMEDAICEEVWNQELLLKDEGASEVDLSLLGVCDGHGDGGQVSAFVTENAAPILRLMIEKIAAGSAIDMSSAEFWSKVWTATSIEIDARLKKKKLEGGSTAVFALTTKDFIITANTGDSRAILVQQDGVKPLSSDHKPEDPIETARVEMAGMTVIHLSIPDENGQEAVYHKIAKDSSLKNTMAVARAYGDFDYKCCKAKKESATEEEEEEGMDLPPEQQPITCIPDVTIHRRQPETDCYLVLACDGIWDVMSNEDVGDFVKNQVKMKNEENDSEALLPEVGDALLQECLQKGSLDNMSTIIVSLQPEIVSLLVSNGEIAPKALEF
ncbi:protein phosphatase 2C [Nitzschia inconspicua]|uniref:Protein phosphatase 2C n=1 Tax=Nitzschia inconspicua TaxID=303405 RepID=A0A9K3LRS9_9STRA|nr:protein phosphatase 2C [Nitzschia inconspicua]